MVLNYTNAPDFGVASIAVSRNKAGTCLATQAVPLQRPALEDAGAWRG